MARVKIYEYTAKTLIHQFFGLEWRIMQANRQTSVKNIENLFKKRVVVKVDQGVKQRGKQGLLLVNAVPQEAVDFIKKIVNKGYERFIIENSIKHSGEEEKYISLERVREGIRILYSERGGVDVEQMWASVKEIIIPFFCIEDKNYKFPEFLQKLSPVVEKLVDFFEQYYLSYLEINPFVTIHGKVYFLDLAVEVDDASLILSRQEILTSGIVAEKNLSEVEKQVQQLDSRTPASLKCKMINPNGSIWMLLSGGGASLVLADEIADIGFGEALGNYGEYSGNPSEEDTYLYTNIILDALLSSHSKQKILVIAGGVANFTDVVKTFKGIIRALDEKRTKLQKAEVKVFVRRGGPNQEKGLSIMKDFLEKNHLLGAVHGPELPLTYIVHQALRNLTS